MDSDRLTRTLDYTDHVFGEQDSHLAGLMDEAVKAGLPDIESLLEPVHGITLVFE